MERNTFPENGVFFSNRFPASAEREKKGGKEEARMAGIRKKNIFGKEKE